MRCGAGAISQPGLVKGKIWLRFTLFFGLKLKCRFERVDSEKLGDQRERNQKFEMSGGGWGFGGGRVLREEV